MRQPPADFRSDTVTRPTPGMQAAMVEAPLGDDVYGEDPTVNALEAYAAELFGKEAALFCPSGTMTNQIAIKLNTEPLSEVICAADAHVYLYEGGGIAFNSAASVRLIPAYRSLLTTEMVSEAINPDDVHHPVTRLVCLENTANRGGGACYDLGQVVRISELCKARGLKLHLDGARLFNALVATGESPEAYGSLFDTLSICLSKGLGAPVGSLLLGTTTAIKQARRIRKVLGGGWRQAGMLAAAGLYALQHQVSRLAQDHARAATLGSALADKPFVAELLPVETNIVLFCLAEGHTRAGFQQYCKEQGVLVGGFGERWVRLVTHLDVDDAAIDQALAAISQYTQTTHAEASKYV